jgi:uncharacterized Zn finger protein (UPF0148 family)
MDLPLHARECRAASDQRRRREIGLRDHQLLVVRGAVDRAQPRDDLERTRRAREGIEPEKLEDERIECRRYFCDVIRGRRTCGLPAFGQTGKVFCGVRMTPGERVVERGAERVEIRARIERLAVDRFRSAVSGGSDDTASVPADRRHGTEVDQLREAVGRAAHVSRTEIAVHHRARVQKRQRRADVLRHRASAPVVHRNELREIAARQQLHRVVGARVVDRVVVDFDDTRVR